MTVPTVSHTAEFLSSSHPHPVWGRYPQPLLLLPGRTLAQVTLLLSATIAAHGAAAAGQGLLCLPLGFHNPALRERPWGHVSHRGLFCMVQRMIREPCFCLSECIKYTASQRKRDREMAKYHQSRDLNRGGSPTEAGSWGFPQTAAHPRCLTETGGFSGTNVNRERSHRPVGALQHQAEAWWGS